MPQDKVQTLLSPAQRGPSQKDLNPSSQPCLFPSPQAMWRENRVETPEAAAAKLGRGRGKWGAGHRLEGAAVWPAHAGGQGKTAWGAASRDMGCGQAGRTWKVRTGSTGRSAPRSVLITCTHLGCSKLSPLPSLSLSLYPLAASPDFQVDGARAGEGWPGERDGLQRWKVCGER